MSRYLLMFLRILKKTIIRDVSRPFGRPVYPLELFSSFVFQLYSNKKYVEVAIKDFTMHLIISKWIRKQNCKHKINYETKRRESDRKNCRRKCFHLFKYVIDHGKSSLFLLDFFTNLLQVTK